MWYRNCCAQSSMTPRKVLGDGEGGIARVLSDEGLMDLIWHVDSSLIGLSGGNGIQVEF